MELDEISLWNLFLEGDKEILEVFYKRYYNLLYNYGLKLCADRDLVKDFIQDVFLKLCKSEKIGTTISPKAYLLKSMRNVIFDHFATQKKCVSMDDLAFIMPDDKLSFELFLQESDGDIEREKRLFAAVAQLSGSQKQFLYLHYIKDLSHKEIAEMLDVNVQSSMNSVSRSLAKLRSLLGSADFLLIPLLLPLLRF